MTRPASTIRWSTRSIFIATAAVAVMLGAYLHGGPLAGAGVLFVLLLAGAHVVGTLVGHHLRDAGQLVPEDADEAFIAGIEPGRHDRRDLVTLPHSRQIHGDRGTAVRSAVSIVVGALLGGILGGGALMGAYPNRLNPLNITMAIAASGLIGGLAVFCIARLVGVVRRGLRRESDGLSSRQPIAK